MKIPIFTDDPGWHGKQLKQAFATHGIEAVFVSLQQCVTHLSSSETTIHIPHFESLPPAAFVRGISGGTLQQIITRLNLLHILKAKGLNIYNDGKAIETTVDKTFTNFVLQTHGMLTPTTWVCESRQAAQLILDQAEEAGKSLIIKPLFGSQGLGVQLLTPGNKLPVPMQQFVDGVYYLQEFIQSRDKPHDYRLFVINGKVVASMKRTGADWLNNVAAGGQCESAFPDQEMTAMAEKAASVLAMDYAGVDIIQSNDGQYYILEVNSIPAWRGLQRTTQQNMAQLLVDDFVLALNV